MAIILLSVPHTGTRFAWSFLDALGVVFRQEHTEPSMIEEIQLHLNPKFVIPMRDPLLTWVSHYLEVEHPLHITRFEFIKNITPIVMEFWTWLEYFEERNEYIHLRLDTDDKGKTLQDVADFVGADMPISNFEWRNVGVSAGMPSDYDLWNIMSKEFSQEEVKYIEISLLPMRERYGYV